MSKRYGRQQKRQAKVEADALKDSISYYVETNKILHHTNQRAKHIVNNVARILGPNFIALDAKDASAGYPGAERFRAHAYEELKVAGFDMANDYVDDALRVLELPVMIYKDMLEDMRAMMHFNIVHDGIHVGYAASTQDLAHMPADIAIETIMREMVANIVAEYVKKHGNLHAKTRS